MLEVTLQVAIVTRTQVSDVSYEGARYERYRCSDVDAVLPLELSPHASELRFVAICGLDVVHNVDVDVV